MNKLFMSDENETSVINQLKEYDDLYYNDGVPTVDDEEYDALKGYAKNQYPENSYFKEIGAKVVGEKVKLQYILGSLNKVKIDSVENWMNKTGATEFVVLEKLDGASIEVDYENGKVVFGATRGDGSTGQNITDKAKVFCPDMNSTEYMLPDRVCLRAEAMLIHDTHTKLGFKTRRNGVVGILNRDGIKNADKIVPFFYEFLNSGDLTMHESMQFMTDAFLDTKARVADGYVHDTEKDKIGDLVSFLHQIKEDRKYDIDGLVLCPIDYKRENVEYPKNKIAFKVNEKPVDARVVNIEWSVGRTGRIIPIVHVEPIELQGVTVRKTTGFNYKFIVDNKLGKGSLIKMVRSGDVIPYITEVRTEGTGPLIPHNCPSCGRGLSPIGVDLVCHNPNCGVKLSKRIEHFLIRMGAENITRKTLEKLEVKSIEALYGLDELIISTHDGFGVKRGEQICTEIDKTLTTTPDRFISALGMPLVGRSVSKLVVDYLKPKCENEDHIMERAFTIHPDELMKIDGVGEAIAHSWFKNIRVYGESLLSWLYNEGLKWEGQSESIGITGLTFALTGKGPMSRGAVQKMITANGGTVKGISKKTDILVIGDVNSTSTKAKKAREYEIEIISYEKLIEMLEG